MQRLKEDNVEVQRTLEALAAEKAVLQAQVCSTPPPFRDCSNSLPSATHQIHLLTAFDHETLVDVAMSISHTDAGRWNVARKAGGSCRSVSFLRSGLSCRVRTKSWICASFSFRARQIRQLPSELRFASICNLSSPLGLRLICLAAGEWLDEE